MYHLKHFLLALVVACSALSCSKNTTGPDDKHVGEYDFLVDHQATAATASLFTNLKKIALSDRFIFGQEFPTDFRFLGGLNSDVNQSDCKDVIGDHPGLHGSDFHYYLNKPAAEKNIHLAAVNAAHSRGAVVAFDWHMLGMNSATFYMQGNEDLLANILADQNGAKAWFYRELDKAIAIINELGFPIVFRPFHEMNGSWFWWHAANPDDYKILWRMLVDYFIQNEVHNVLYCWAPNYAQNEDYFTYYPGDDYVDILGLDAYEPGIAISHARLFTVIVQMVDYATLTGKFAAFTETGDRSSYPDQRPDFWTKDVLYPINGNPKARQIAWLMTWINSNWGTPSSNARPFIPYKELDNIEAKIDFAEFYKDPHTLFERDVPDMYK